MAKSKFERLPGFRDFPPEEFGAIKNILADEYDSGKSTLSYFI